MALRALSTKQTDSPSRPLRATTPYYTRNLSRRKKFVLGDKPGALKHLGHVDKKVWKQFQTHLSRTTPLERAEYYVRELRERKMRSHHALARLLGEPINRVGRHMRLLELPEPVKAFLREHREPEYVRFFTETRLQELVRIGDSRAAWRRFQEMTQQAHREAGVWKESSQ